MTLSFPVPRQAQPNWSSWLTPTPQTSLQRPLGPTAPGEGCLVGGCLPFTAPLCPGGMAPNSQESRNSVPRSRPGLPTNHSQSGMFQGLGTTKLPGKARKSLSPAPAPDLAQVCRKTTFLAFLPESQKKGAGRGWGRGLHSFKPKIITAWDCPPCPPEPSLTCSSKSSCHPAVSTGPGPTPGSTLGPASRVPTVRTQGSGTLPDPQSQTDEKATSSSSLNGGLTF